MGSGAEPSVALALHGIPSAMAENSAATILKQVAMQVRAGHISITPTSSTSQASFEEGGHSYLVEDRANLVDADQYSQLVALWEQIGECMVNPTLGFRMMQPEIAQAIAAGFGQIEAFSNSIRDYVSAAAWQEDIDDVEVLIRYPTLTETLDVRISDADDLGFAFTLVDEFTHGSCELSDKLAELAPVAFYVDLKRSGDTTYVVIERLEMRHDRVAPATVVEAAKIIRSLPFPDLSFQLVSNDEDDDEEVDDEQAA